MNGVGDAQGPKPATSQIEVNDPFSLTNACIHSGDFRQAVQKFLFEMIAPDKEEPFSWELDTYIFLRKDAIFSLYCSLLPHFTPDEIASFDKRYFSDLLDCLTPSQQVDLLIARGNFEVPKSTETTFDQLLEGYLRAMPFYARAINIAEGIAAGNEKKRAAHCAASLSLSHLARLRYIGENLFATRLQRLLERSVDDFLHWFGKIQRLKGFFSSEEGLIVTKELYAKALAICNAPPEHYLKLEKFRQCYEEIKIAHRREINPGKHGELFNFPEFLPTERFRRVLDNYRGAVSALAAEDVREYQHQLFSKFREIFGGFVDYAIEIAGPPPDDSEFMICAMGSVGKLELLSYSDLDICILYDAKKSDDTTKPDPSTEKRREVKEYLERVVKLIDMQMISLGETKNGLHLKNGSQVPICTPEEMAQLQTDTSKEATFKRNLLRVGILFAASPSQTLLQEYNNFLKSKEVQQSIKENVRELVFTFVQDYIGVWGMPFSPDESRIEMKTSYLPFIHFLGDLSLFLGVSKSNTLDLIEPLLKKCRQLAQQPSDDPDGDKVFESNSRLLKHAVASIHRTRAWQHARVYRKERAIEKKDTVKSKDLDPVEIFDLEKCYWLVLYPFLRELKKRPQDKLVDRISDLIGALSREGLLKMALRGTLELGSRRPVLTDEEDKKRIIYHIVSDLVENNATDDECEMFFRLLCDYELTAPLMFHYVEVLEERMVLRHKDSHGTVWRLVQIANRSGYRVSSSMKVRGLQEHITSKKTTDRVDGDAWVLPPDWKDTLLEKKEGAEGQPCYTGKIKASTVSLGQARWQIAPSSTRSDMEEAVHELSSRLGSRLTPIATHKKFHISREFSCRAAISESIEGSSLESWNDRPEELERKLNKKQWTWMILCSLLIHPKDDHLSNYIVDDQGNIYRVNNQSTFVPLAKGSELQFVSPLFCLNLSLDAEVLDEFCKLHINAILRGWCDMLVETGNELQMRESVLAALSLQFIQLRQFFKTLSNDEKKALTPLHLLPHLVENRADVMSYLVTYRIHTAYTQSLKQKTIAKRLSSAIKAFSDLMTSSEFDHVEVDSRAVAFKEIKQVVERLPGCEDDTYSYWTHDCDGRNLVVVDFQDPKEARKLGLLPTKMQALVVRNFAVVTDTLSWDVFFTPTLEFLIVDNCKAFNRAMLVKLALLCPLLKELVIAHCAGLILSRGTHEIQYDHLYPPIQLPFTLERLWIHDCRKIEAIHFEACSLETIGMFHTGLFLDIKLQGAVPRWDLDSLPTLEPAWKSAEHLLTVAKLGQAKAQFDLGKRGSRRITQLSLFRPIVYVKYFKDEDIALMRQAQEQHYPPAQFFLAVYEFAQGKEATPPELFQDAAKNGHFAARRLLDIDRFQSGTLELEAFDYSFHVGKGSSAKRQIVNSLEDLREILALTSKAPPLLSLLRAELHYLLGRIPEALSLFLQVLQVDDQEPFASARCQQLLPFVLKDGIHDDVLDPLTYLMQEFKKLSPRNDLSLDETLRRGRLYALMGDATKAKQDLNKVIGKDPQNPLALAFLGDLVSREKTDEEPYSSDLDTALALYPTSFAYLSRGDFHRKKGSYDLALADFTKAIACDPSHGLAWAKRGEICLLLSYFGRAGKDIDKAHSINKNNGFILLLQLTHRNMAVYREKGKAVLHDFWQLERLPEHVLALRAHFYLVRMRAFNREINHPWSYLDAIHKEYPFAKARLGICYSRKGWSDRAVTAFDETLKKEPNNAFALVQRGQSREQIGDKHGAATDYRKSIDIDPNNSFALFLMGEILRSEGNLEEALTYYDGAIDHDPRYFTALCRRGLIHYLRNDDTHALHDARRALEIDSSSYFALKLQGYVFYRQGQLDAALASLTQSLEIYPKDENLSKTIKEIQQSLQDHFQKPAPPKDELPMPTPSGVPVTGKEAASDSKKMADHAPLKETPLAEVKKTTSIPTQFPTVARVGKFSFQGERYEIVKTHQGKGASALHALLGVPDGKVIRFAQGDVKKAFCERLKEAIRAEQGRKMDESPVHKLLYRNLSKMFKLAVKIWIKKARTEEIELTRVFGGRYLHEFEKCHQEMMPLNKEERKRVLLAFLDSILDRYYLGIEHDDYYLNLLEIELAAHLFNIPYLIFTKNESEGEEYQVTTEDGSKLADPNTVLIVSGRDDVKDYERVVRSVTKA